MEWQEKARHNVVVYGWAKVCATNTSSDGQGSFKWPHFVITANVLSEVNLLISPEVEVHVNLHKNTLSTWVKVCIGHVITLKEGDHVFLKGLDISTCANFNHLLSLSNCQVPNFINNLQQK
ncbi:hypothetical protein L208DRAFT_1270644 [Tricholoma matsutake]|nr:hypothetical protein L208DRAFT_1270644 [Tricholoma matsutake 945]